MTLEKCPTCKETVFPFSKHTCKPCFECIEVCSLKEWDPSDPDESSIYHIFESRANNAAESFWRGRCNHSAEYYTGMVCVRPAGTGPDAWQMFEVSVEAEPVYSAQLVKPKKKSEVF